MNFVNVLDEWVARNIVSDNGSLFVSETFSHPMTSNIPERFIQSLKQSLKVIQSFNLSLEG